MKDVVCLYAVERAISKRPMLEVIGKEAMFGVAKHWQLPIAQTEKALSTFLSSLWVFIDLINARHMDGEMQSVVMAVVYALLPFPPALRAVYMLMKSRSPRPSECAALVQTISEALKRMIPEDGSLNDDGSILKFSRLFFGLVLKQANVLRKSFSDLSPFLRMFKTLDLRAVDTLEPLVHPVSLPHGLVERGSSEAYSNGGLLSWSNGRSPQLPIQTNGLTQRLAVQCGGAYHEVVYFDFGELVLSGKNAEICRNLEGHLRPYDIVELSALADACNTYSLNVVLPIALPSFSAPVLTINRDVNLSVFIGRAKCASPGEHVNVFCPTSGEDSHIDAAELTKAQESRPKEYEGIALETFTSLGHGRMPEQTVPKELLMLCIDCSRTMREPSNREEHRTLEKQVYSDQKDTQTLAHLPISTLNDIVNSFLPSGNPQADSSAMSFSEAKALISGHEWFGDMVAIVRAAKNTYQPMLAKKVLLHLRRISFRELALAFEVLEAQKKQAADRSFATVSQWQI